MPLSKTPFPPNRNARELGIDTTRKFVVVNASEYDAAVGFAKTTIIMLLTDDGSSAPKFHNAKGDTRYIFWSDLAYADEPVEKEPYIPRVGDRVSLEGEIKEVNDRSVKVLVGGTMTWVSPRAHFPVVAKFLSRKPPRKITRAELEKLVGEAFEIVDSEEK